MTDSPANQTCQQCGARLAPGLRYCVTCYRLVPGTDSSSVHTHSAEVVASTRRTDPTIVFLPGEHEALKRRRVVRRRVTLAIGLGVVLVAAGVTVWSLLSRESRETQQAVARDNMARRELALLADALERFRNDVGRYPTEREGIASLRRKPAGSTPDHADQLSFWSGPYIDAAIELDPWGNDYVYRLTADGAGFELYSPGPGGDESGNVHLRVASPN